MEISQEEIKEIVDSTCIDEHCGVVAKSVAVVGVEVGWIGAATFIPEEVMLSLELANKATLVFHLLELLSNHLAEQFLGLDERQLHVAVRIAVESELASHSGWQGLKALLVLRR